MVDYVSLGFTPFETVLEEARGGADALILASGGLDSAYCLWAYSQAVSGRAISLHHIKLYPTMRKRHIAEEICVRRQAEYIGSNVGVFVSVLDLDPEYRIPTMPDFHAAVILSVSLAVQQKCKYIVVGDDIIHGLLRSQGMADALEDHASALSAIRTLAYHLSDGRVEICLSMASNDVYAAYDQMPDEFMALCFSCRSPKFNEISAYKCGDCVACHRNDLLGLTDRLCKQVIWSNR